MTSFTLWDIVRNLLLATRWTIGLSLIASSSKSASPSAPLSIATLGPLPKREIPAGAGIYSLTRQLGSSIRAVRARISCRVG